jgi:hypothetical protein
MKEKMGQYTFAPNRHNELISKKRPAKIVFPQTIDDSETVTEKEICLVGQYAFSDNINSVSRADLQKPEMFIPQLKNGANAPSMATKEGIRIDQRLEDEFWKDLEEAWPVDIVMNDLHRGLKATNDLLKLLKG